MGVNARKIGQMTLVIGVMKVYDLTKWFTGTMRIGLKGGFEYILCFVYVLKLKNKILYKLFIICFNLILGSYQSRVV